MRLKIINLAVEYKIHWSEGELNTERPAKTCTSDVMGRQKDLDMEVTMRTTFLTGEGQTIE